MKIRSGFVSNSSSSSFICDVCGEVEAGYDLTLNDANMYKCEKGHTICEDHRLNVSKYDKGVDHGTINDSRYKLPVEFCPICNLNDIPSEDMLAYLLKGHGLTNAEVTKKIKEVYGNYEKFSEYIKK